MMSAEYFKAIIDCVGDPIFARDQEYKFVFVNDAACEMLGKPREQMLEKTDYELFPKEQADVFRKTDDAVFETGEESVSEEQITDARGEVRTIVTKKTLYVNKAGEKYVVGAIRDITDRKRAEEALFGSEAKYRTIVENSLAGIYIHQDGLFRFVNRRFCEIYGYACEELVDKLGPMDMTHPEERHVIQERVTELLAGKLNANRFTCTAIRKDGTTIIVNVLGNLITYRGGPAISGAVYDITEQQRAKEQLQEKTALLEAQVNASLDGIIVVERGKKVLQNQQVIDLLKIPRHIAESDDDEAQIAWVESQVKDPEEFHEKLAYIFAHPGETMRDELELKDGTVLDRYCSPVIGNDGKRYGGIVTLRDITERKRSEEAIRRHAEELDTLNFIGLQVGASLSFEENAQAALKGILRAIKPDMTFLFMREGERLILSTMQPENALQYLEAVSHVVGECICDMAVRDNRPIYSRDIHTDPRCTSKECKTADMKSFAAIPLRSGGDIFGLICLASKAERDFEKQAEFLETMAGTVSASLMNSKLFKAVQLHVINLEKNITMRRRAEEALKAAHQQLMDIIEFLPDATFVIDLEKRVIAWNKAIEEMTGVKKEDMLGKGDYAYAVPFYGKPRPLTIDLALEWDAERAGQYDFAELEEDTLLAANYVPMTYEGKGAHLSAKASPLFDAEGHVIGAIESIRDITEQKQTEEALRNRERELKDKSVNLEEANAALKVLLRHRDEDNKTLEGTVLANIRQLVFPYIEKLRSSSLMDSQATCLNIIESNLNEVISPFLRKMTAIYSHFTPMEIQVADLIRNGRTSEEIGELLKVGMATVHTHRNNIRKKLGLSNEKMNLRTYLLSLQE
jgi:PAS domain S-box-containing protein